MLVLISSFLVGCNSSGDAVKAIIEQLEFYEGDEGCVEMETTLDLNPVPLVNSNTRLGYKKNTGPNAPDC